MMLFKGVEKYVWLSDSFMGYIYNCYPCKMYPNENNLNFLVGFKLKNAEIIKLENRTYNQKQVLFDTVFIMLDITIVSQTIKFVEKY